MNTRGAIEGICIAGRKTCRDWFALRDALEVGNPDKWSSAFTDFFEARLYYRYFLPIEVLQKNDNLLGEGFSIAALHCSLIEFLEATVQGKTYRHVRGREKLGDHEYSSSEDLYISFLTKREPFLRTFDVSSARDFYASVRCGLLHEAGTKNGWRIRADSDAGAIADTASRVVFRNGFHGALREFTKSYSLELPMNQNLQEAFIRKFNSICS